MSVAEPATEEHTPEESLKQENLEEAEQQQKNKFGTFGGVFTPTVLTILGVILFLRVGWVVGQAGLIGALVIVVVSFLITTCTALAMSTIATNIRIGAGGAYAVIAQSLGLEVGGAVGIPRYLSQALAVTMYIFGFREGWVYMFEEMIAGSYPILSNPLYVDLAVFALLYLIAYISADFAIKTQYVIMAVIGAALVSIGMAAGTGSMEHSLSEIQLWGEFEGASFWIVFAVFFPATTGIMAGANMSGDLKDPKKSIPKGTLWAIGVSFVIYVLLVVWLAFSATTQELLTNYQVALDKAYFPGAVVGGLLGATFSSALASLVGSARILQAMGAHHIVPEDEWLAELSDNAEPRHAMMVTGVLILLSIMLRDLNTIAPLITMFFLVTYVMICAAVTIEQGLDMVSFRPILRVPIWVSLLGLVGSLVAMFIINPILSLISLGVTVGFYIFLAQRQLDAPFEDVRSGLFQAFSEWSAQRVEDLPDMYERAWKPSLLVPVTNPAELPGSFDLLRDLTYPKGSLRLVKFTQDWEQAMEEDELGPVTRRFRKEGIFTRSAYIEEDTFTESVLQSMVLSGGFFGPNTVFLELPDELDREDDYRHIIDKGRHFGLGIYLFSAPNDWVSSQSAVNVWVADMSPDWNPEELPVNLDLALLTGYLLQRNWSAEMNVVCGIDREQDMEAGERFLENYLRQARLTQANLHLTHGGLDDVIEDLPEADLDIIGFPDEYQDFHFMREMVDRTDTASLFVQGTGRENALA